MCIEELDEYMKVLDNRLEKKQIKPVGFVAGPVKMVCPYLYTIIVMQNLIFLLRFAGEMPVNELELNDSSDIQQTALEISMQVHLS